MLVVRPKRELRVKKSFSEAKMKFRFSRSVDLTRKGSLNPKIMSEMSSINPGQKKTFPRNNNDNSRSNGNNGNNGNNINNINSINNYNIYYKSSNSSNEGNNSNSSNEGNNSNSSKNISNINKNNNSNNNNIFVNKKVI